MLLAVDQGTTNTKALLVDHTGAILFRAIASAPLRHSSSGEIDQDPAVLWSTAREVILACAQHAEGLRRSIAGICLTNQRETAIAWDRISGKPLAQAISWQCRRSSTVCAEVEDHAALIQQKSGLPLDPLLSATKWAWMLRNEPRVQIAAKAGTLALGTVDSWLLHRLTGGRVHATDTTNASRTGLLDLDRVCWDNSLFELFGIRAEWMPAIMSSACCFGLADANHGFGEVPIVAVAGDSHAAMLGHGKLQPGAVKTTYGTGSSLMALTPELPHSSQHLARTIAWTLPTPQLRAGTQYALEGNITMSGAALEWVGQFLGLSNPSRDAAALAEQVTDSGGLMFVPAMAGLGAPHWKAQARGTITGLQPHHRAAHLARAALDAIAMQVADVVNAMRSEAQIDINELLADGGATRNATLMQTEADVLGMPVLRSLHEELSALGVARLGGLTLGYWADLASAEVLNPPVDIFLPKIDISCSADRHAAWDVALRRTLLEASQ